MNIFRWISLTVFLLVGLAACTDIAPRKGDDILVLGDSILSWNGTSDASIGDAVEAALNRRVISKAVPGAQFDNASVVAGAVGFDIQRQLPAGRWNWVVINGGANDLSADCGCGACGPSVEALIGADTNSGAIPTFIRKIRKQTGANVIWLGYYAGSGTGAFAGCRKDLVKIEARIVKFASREDGVVFADAEDVIDRRDQTLFASDNIHPSAKGSALIGKMLAGEITERETRSQPRR